MTHVNGTNDSFNILKVELASVFLAEREENACSAGSVKASHRSKMKAPVGINAECTRSKGLKDFNGLLYIISDTVFIELYSSKSAIVRVIQLQNTKNDETVMQ